jgi:hypothetical protein
MLDRKRNPPLREYTSKPYTRHTSRLRPHRLSRAHTDLHSSALTGSSIPRPESTTAPFARQQASPQIQLSPAMASRRPSNWPSTSSPPTQRSTQSTQVLSTAAFRLLHPSPPLALHRTATIPKSRRRSSISKLVLANSTVLHASITLHLQRTRSFLSTSQTTSPQSGSRLLYPRPKARVYRSSTTVSHTASTN